MTIHDDTAITAYRISRVSMMDLLLRSASQRSRSILLPLGPRGAKTVSSFVLLQSFSNGPIQLVVFNAKIFLRSLTGALTWKRRFRLAGGGSLPDRNIERQSARSSYLFNANASVNAVTRKSRCRISAGIPRTASS